jgi:hypothetical protein
MNALVDRGIAAGLIAPPAAPVLSPQRRYVVHTAESRRLQSQRIRRGRRRALGKIGRSRA